MKVLIKFAAILVLILMGCKALKIKKETKAARYKSTVATVTGRTEIPLPVSGVYGILLVTPPT